MPLQVGMEEGPRSKAVLVGCNIASTARRNSHYLLSDLVDCFNSYKAVYECLVDSSQHNNVSLFQMQFRY
jgi:hypothetical protein